MTKEQSVFHDLSSSLSESERSDLLHKIRESLNMQQDGGDTVYHKEISQEERLSLARHELQMISVFQRFILWLKSKFLGRKITDLFIQHKLKTIKNTIRRKVPGITGFETRDLSPKLAQAVFDLYSHITGVRPIFRNLWTKQAMFETMTITLLEESIEEPKRELTQLISLEEMEALYAQHQTQSAIRDEVVKRIDEYVRMIPGIVFSSLERKILPIYNLKEIMLFPFHSFFDQFHFTPNTNKPDGPPFFRSAAAHLCLDMLEKLYCALYSVTKIADSPHIESRLLFALNDEFTEDDDSGKKQPGVAPVDDDFGNEISEEQFSTEIETIVKSSKRLFSKMPIAELIKYFKKDPYYKLIFYTPSLDLEAFYTSVLKIRFLGEVAKAFSEVRSLYIEKQIQLLFKDRNYSHFQFYRIYASIDYEKIGLPFFVHTKSLSLLHNYIQCFYRENMQEIVQILDRGVLAQNRITRDRLLQHAAALEDVNDRIKQFDASLSADHEDGKLFQRLRFSLASEMSNQKMFRALVLQKDREVRDLLERGERGLGGLRKIFEELVTSSSDSVRIQIRSHYMIGGKPASLETTLRTWMNHLNTFLQLFAQVLRIEKG